MKNTLNKNLRAFRDQIRAEELNREARIVTPETYHLDLVSQDTRAQETQAEPFGFNPFLGLALE
jgi:hypothetical protein